MISFVLHLCIPHKPRCQYLDLIQIEVGLFKRNLPCNNETLRTNYLKNNRKTEAFAME